MSTRIGPHHGGEERQESAEILVERIVAEEPRRRRWATSDLERRRKGDWEKVKLAKRLCGEPTMT